MRRIGTITPVWNQELFIKPHFEMLSKLDKNVVLLAKQPLPDYRDQHGYDTRPDLSEHILRTQFPNVKIYESTYNGPFGCELYNEGLKYVQDCDIVLRLDVDMLFTDKMWKWFIDYIRFSTYDSYRVDFNKNTINYYITGDYSHGLKDAQEFDVLGFNPKIPFEPVLNYPMENCHVFEKPADEIIFHHFRGWNKPKSVPKDWYKTKVAKQAWKESGKKWHTLPAELRLQMNTWLSELQTIREELSV